VEPLVIVGASLAGLRTAEAARRSGWDRELVVVGEESHMPYTRPPLSKELLTTRDSDLADHLLRSEVEATWALGERATGIDRDSRRLKLASGETLAYERLVIATGCRARRWSGPGAELAGLHVIRHAEDALALRAALARRPRVAIVGAGFIGCEVASSARALGLEVSLFDIALTPMSALGSLLGERCAELHRSHGVKLYLGRGIEALYGEHRLVRGIELVDGTRHEADLVVVALGAVPCTDWLADSGLGVEYGVRCDATQVVITEGAQSALSLCVSLLTNPGDTAWLEDPGYRGAKAAFHAGDLHVIPMRVDDNGMAIPREAWLAHPPRLVQATPAHQYPTGAVLSISRRLDLIKRATEVGAWIVEDDYDSEFRHQGAPIAAMQGLVVDAPVLYVGSFSKSMFPALRLGFLVLPKTIAQSAEGSLRELLRGGHRLEQLAMANFIDSGQFARHLGRMRRLYRERQNALRDALATHLGVEHQVLGGHSGLHLTVRLPPQMQDRAITDEARRVGMSPAPLSAFAMAPLPEDNGLVIGYGNAQLMAPLQRRVGDAWARELSLTCEYIDAETALRIGLVNHVVAHEDLLPQALAAAQAIATKDRAAVAAMRQQWDAMQGQPLRTARQLHDHFHGPFKDVATAFADEERVQQLMSRT